MTTDIEDQTRRDPNRKLIEHRRPRSVTARVSDDSIRQAATVSPKFVGHALHGTIPWDRARPKFELACEDLADSRERRARRELCDHARGFAQRRSQVRQPKLGLPRDESVPLGRCEGARTPGLRERHARHLYGRAEPAVVFSLWMPPRRRLAKTVAISTSVDNLRT